MSCTQIVDVTEYKSLANAENFFCVLDRCVSVTLPLGKKRTPYRTMIAIGPEDEHFCWFHYRAGRNNVDCIVEPAIPVSQLQEVKEVLKQAGVKWKNFTQITNLFEDN
jgi:hypothetical protein